MLINKAALAAIFVGFKTIFNEAFTGTASVWEQVGMLVPSSTKQETYAWLGQTTQFREWLGDRVIQNLGTHNYTILNKSFENTVGVDRDDIDDDTIGVYSPLVRQLGASAKAHPDRLIFQLIKNGFAGICYDGQFFFDIDHPVRDANGVEQSVSNMQAGAGTPWFLLDTSKMIKPFIFQKRRDYKFVAMDNEEDEAVFQKKQFRYGVDARVNAGYGLWQLAFGSKAALSAANYAAARKAMMEFKGDNTEPLGIMPTLLVVPPEHEAAAREVIMAERNAAGATNVYRDTAKLLVTPWLA